MRTVRPIDLPPGAIISVAVRVGPIFVDHVGIVSDLLGADGHPTIVAASKRRGKVTEEKWSVFTEGKRAKVHSTECALSPEQVLARARSRLGEQWDLLGFNCEHFVRWAHGHPIASPQLRVGAATGVLAAIGVGLIVVSARR